MTSLELSRTNLTPEVSFRPERGVLTLTGECYPENPTAFFGPIFSALERHFRAAPPDEFLLRCELSYVNSASTKALRRLFRLLDAMGQHRVKIRVDWAHEPDDETMIELGRDLSSGLHFLDYHEEPLDPDSASVG
jgi:hypothetical protein